MTDPRKELEWTELRVSDSAFDAPDDTDFSPIRAVRLRQDSDPPSTGLSLRWCAALATAALVAAVAAVGFAEHRGRTETSVKTAAPPLAGVDAAGCPRGDTCSALDGLYGGLSQAMNVDLPPNEQLFATELIDNSSSSSTRRLRIVQLTNTGVRVLAISQCRPDHTSVNPWSSGLSGVGPKLAVLVKATTNGCSLALIAQVPASVPVPVAALQSLAADTNAEGG